MLRMRGNGRSAVHVVRRIARRQLVQRLEEPDVAGIEDERTTRMVGAEDELREKPRERCAEVVRVHGRMVQGGRLTSYGPFTKNMLDCNRRGGSAGATADRRRSYLRAASRA